NGNPFAATATATGLAGGPVTGSFAFTYYAGSTATGTGSSTPPTDAGTYTVVASFASADSAYLGAQSSPVTFTIAQSTTSALIASSLSSSVYGQSVTFTA